ncbi:hypothetical protein K0M31_008805 [Melipona bicolor]|uniref:C2H2-type domain-containing protein n=1 Tax=Melipona bicolor TaxID=60889 RepID=A0AA40FQD6_9HYME|nr:hypothetical protein K0M31_008805 [Melipona bicolor]
MLKRKIRSIGEDSSYFRDIPHVSKIEKSTILRNNSCFSLQLPYGLSSGLQPYMPSMNLPQKDEMKYLRNDGNLMNICFGCGKRYKWRDSLLRHQRVECERKYSPNAGIEWYYQYQSLYLQLMAENQVAEKAVSENSDCSGTVQHSGNFLNDFIASMKMPKNGFDKPSMMGNRANGSVRDSLIYSCSRCGNAYTRSHSLNRHIKFECGVEPQFECPICHKKSKHKHNLVLHMKTHKKS